jgi:FKBP-type peptidyl-prolyl cis-trans isomerase 2
MDLLFYLEKEQVMKIIKTIITIILLLLSATCYAQNKGGNMTVEKGKEVSINYTLKVDGQVVDTSEGRGPLTYTHGQGQIIPGLSKELEGLKVGDKKDVTVKPEDGYGQANPQAIQEVPKSQLPNNITPETGMNLQVSTPEGRTQVVKITDVKDDVVVIDMNHPLAGKTLNFEVEIMSIK